MGAFAASPPVAAGWEDRQINAINANFPLDERGRIMYIMLLYFGHRTLSLGIRDAGLSVCIR
jgi:hypothetical protein